MVYTCGARRINMSMGIAKRIDQALTAAVDQASSRGCPPRLAEALSYSVFPGGARVRPRLCLAVAGACGDDAPGLADAAAAAIELLHCASLVHDDMPCFDDSPLRRGKPTVHKAFGERLALLVGDAMIVLAFQTLARGGRDFPERLGPLVLTIGEAVGMPVGICAGQAWESEPRVVLSDYHNAKTGALFVAACVAGAQAAGADPAPWRRVGERLGEAYQVADDLRDTCCSVDELGKPVQQDILLGRPNAVHELGVNGAVQRLRGLVDEAVVAVPSCPGSTELKALIAGESHRILPKELALRAA
jgi:geranylgeranyl diphosphate synthase type II